MSAHEFFEGGYRIDTTPLMTPGGKFVARAIVTRADSRAEELSPDFEPFMTEAEASSAAHIAAVAWISHQDVAD